MTYITYLLIGLYGQDDYILKTYECGKHVSSKLISPGKARMMDFD